MSFNALVCTVIPNHNARPLTNSITNTIFEIDIENEFITLFPTGFCRNRDKED